MPGVPVAIPSQAACRSPLGFGYDCPLSGRPLHEEDRIFRSLRRPFARRDLRLRAARRLERQHDAARAPGPAGAQRLPAARARAGRALDRLRRPSRRRVGESAHRQDRGQRHLDHRRQRSAPAEIHRAHPGRARPGRDRRRADGARVQGKRAAEGGQVQGVPAAHVRQSRARGLGRDRAGEAGAPHGGGRQAEGDAQELVGVRQRYRLPRLGPARLAHSPHDAGLRPLRPDAAALHPQLRPGRPGAGLERRGADRAARPDLDRPEG